MLWLTSTSDVLKIITGGAQAVHVHVSFIDFNGSTTPATVTPGNANVTTSSATTTNITPAVPANTQRNVKVLNVENTDASNAITVTLEHFDGTNTIPLWNGSIPAGWKLSRVDRKRWKLNDQTGRDL